VLVLSLIFGNRTITVGLTNGFLGRKYTEAWKYSWILSVAFKHLGNLYAALLTHKANGYSDNFHIWQLYLFYFARPRIEGIVGGLFASNSPQSSYRSFGFASIIAELVTFPFTAQIMGMVASLAGKTSAFWFNQHQGIHGFPMHLMYGATVWWLLTSCLIVLLPLFLLRLRDEERKREKTKTPVPVQSFRIFKTSALLLPTIYLGQWLFISGYVRLGPEL